MKRVMAVAVAVLLLAGCGDDDGGGPPQPTATPEGTAVDTATQTFTPTPTRTITPTATITPTLGPGANIGFIGLLRADNTLLEPIGVDAEGRSIYERPTGSGFVIVVEAQPGTNNRPVGDFAFNDDGPPDLQIESDKDLGDGSGDVCDNEPGRFGGVPGIDPPDFEYTETIVGALNDFGCRFTNGAGEPVGRDRNDGCIMFSDGNFGFANDDDTIQFCGTVTRPMRLPEGEAILTARVLDNDGIPGPERQIVVRVLGP